MKRIMANVKNNVRNFQRNSSEQRSLITNKACHMIKDGEHSTIKVACLYENNRICCYELNVSMNDHKQTS